MKSFVMFLVLTLVVFMPEPGECRGFNGIRSAWTKGRGVWKATRTHRHALMATARFGIKQYRDLKAQREDSQ
ncbi:hypothetical protein FQN60_015380, partial [Etheostoma spectabile]